MKIVNREEFLKLPGGTIYCCIEDRHIGDIALKCNSLSHDDGTLFDWYYYNLKDFEHDDSSEYFNRLYRMESTGCSYPLDLAIERDGRFDDQDRFLIYEKDDVNKLMQLLLFSTMGFRSE